MPVRSGKEAYANRAAIDLLVATCPTRRVVGPAVVGTVDPE
jgi:hypothetical protein